ncbi:MAG: sodium:solute symporter family protein, partial [Phycisphaerae bacterium]|nr:sodium:solute symporter family protein [Phycisphaerae bacterium]
SGIWAQWLWLFCTPFYWLIAPVFRRMRYLTTADYFRERFHGSMEVAFVAMGILVLTVDMGVMLLGQGKIIHSVTNGEVSIPVAIFVMVAMFLFYGVSGGLIAAIITDFIQGFFIVIMSFLMIPIALYKVGGFSGLHAKLDPEMFSLVASGKYTLFYIVMISLNALVNIVAQPHTMGNCAAGKTEYEGRVGFCFGTFIKRICTVWWAFTGLFAVILFHDVVKDHPELAFGRCVEKLLPVGLTGVMLASMMAAMMSSCDSLMIAMSGLFTRNVYQQYLVKDRDPAHYLVVIRIVSIMSVVLGLGWAFYFDSLFHGLELFWKLSALIGVAFWLGLLWRRANRYGAWAAFLSASIVYVGTNQGWIPLPPFTPETFAQWSSKLAKPEIWAGLYSGGTLNFWPLNVGTPDAWSYVFYLTAGFLMGIIVTLITPPEPPEKIQKFFTLISTPVGKENELKAQGIEIMHEGDRD